MAKAKKKSASRKPAKKKPVAKKKPTAKKKPAAKKKTAVKKKATPKRSATKAPAKPTAPAAKRHKQKAFSNSELASFRKLIVEQRTEAQEEFNILSEQAQDTTGEYDTEVSPYSMHMAEQGTDAM